MEQPESQNNTRQHTRYQVVLPVVIDSEEYGSYTGLVINISSGGLFIQTYDPLPIGTTVTLTVGDADGFMVTGTVRSHYYMTYRSDTEPAAFTGMGIKFHKFMNSPKAPRPFPAELVN